MDTIWECMNVASRIAKQIENSDALVPRNQVGVVTPMADLQELSTTVNSVRTTLVPFVTSSKKTKVVSEPSFEINIKGIKDTLNDLHQFFKDLEKEFSVYTWKTQKVKVYQLDFSLKQKLDQFTGLFNTDAEGSPTSSKKKVDKERTTNGASVISDPEGRELWTKSFGESTIMVPWNVFFPTLEAHQMASFKDDEEFIKMFMDFTKDDHISSYEFSIFLKLFGPLKGCCQRMLDALRGGLLCGFVPAVEANLLLEGKKEGTYLVRCSKTQPGSFAVTFVDNMQKVKHCLLYNVHPNGLTLKSPPTVYNSLNEFAEAHGNKLKHPLGNRWTLMKRVNGFQFDGKLMENGTTANNQPTSPQAISENSQCVVCMDAPFETVFLECGHLACCQKCSEKLKLCPICRNTIVRIIPIFRAT
eukprot:TRINITY_DN1639_c0_g2_i1.p1 TRINITY_DN1639_c0_g2~~TRINITY_DN1639_c0_g2_i1.p1  ORF type:complete len:415 (-),score=118.10 TRINITY_DN1639_c0_g2_i1:1073-2317(-)